MLFEDEARAAGVVVAGWAAATTEVDGFSTHASSSSLGLRGGERAFGGAAERSRVDERRERCLPLS
jgi:hypothetical protein